jgi:Ca2+-transporting ATPase
MCNDARYELDGEEYAFLGDPTEEALIRTAFDFNLDKKLLTEKEPKIQSFEFDSHRKMMSKLRIDGKNKILYSKGAPKKFRTFFF